jgi:uncharacterized Zn finger protein
MMLNNIISHIDPVILDRGREYVLCGYIRKLERLKNLVYRAEVIGSELYEVSVELDEHGGIRSLECDCPFDYGPICKHQAAVLLELREKIKSLDININDIPLTEQKNFKDLLEAQSKESLIELILSLSADSDVVEKRVKLHVLETGGDVELQQCRKLIQSYISLHADDYGYVSWKNTSRAVEGAYISSEKAHEAADNEECYGL